MGHAYQRLTRHRQVVWYRVPEARVDEFLIAQRTAQESYERHALGWSLARRRDNPEIWRELGPEFREDAAVRNCAAELDSTPDMLPAIAAFEIEYPPHADVFAGGFGIFETSREYDSVARVGDIDRTARLDLPSESPEKMTDAMREACALAAALATRLDAVVPEPISVVASNEMVIICDAGGRRTWRSLVDWEIEEASRLVLDSLQDFLTDELTVPWPHDPARGYVFHEPHAERRGNELHLWYGDEDDPVLVLDAVPLRDCRADDDPGPAPR